MDRRKIIRVIAAAGFVLFPFVLFAADRPPLAELEQRLAAQQAEIMRLQAAAMADEARVAALERANEPKLAITDPATQAFANLPYVARIRIKDSSGSNFGTGSVIFSQKGKAVILTAGHIFKKFDSNSKIEVDIFNPATGKIETFSGKALRWDFEADVGLLSIPADRVIPALPLAPLDEAAKPGQQVISYGCGGGDPPSPQLQKVTIVNRYLGPDNVECTGVPLQGRSGGGLVDLKNRLVGVIIAADTRDQRGLHAGLKPIYDLLGKAGIDLKVLPCNAPPLPALPKK